MASVRVILCPVEGPASIRRATFADMQKGVGGYIERLGIDQGLSLYCNEEALRLKLPMNPHTPPLRYMAQKGSLHGPFYVVRHDDEGELIDVTEADIAAWVN